ncbi:MAG: prepilin peptidase [Actinomycetota bacterium]|nr:prepilin peptidase [Actinomycetota bacterium]
MTIIDTPRAAPARTADRIERAWAAAHPVTRRALVAAFVTAVALSALVGAPMVVKWACAATGALLAAAALVDMHERRLPNRLLAAALLVTLTGTAAGAAATGSATALAGSLAGLALGGGCMLAVRLTRGVGMGDVKMAAVVGASTGAFAVAAAPVAIAVAAFSAGCYGLAAGRRRLALGPSLWFGWAVSLGLVASGWWA